MGVFGEGTVRGGLWGISVDLTGAIPPVDNSSGDGNNVRLGLFCPRGFSSDGSLLCKPALGACSLNERVSALLIVNLVNPPLA